MDKLKIARVYYDLNWEAQIWKFGPVLIFDINITVMLKNWCTIILYFALPTLKHDLNITFLLMIPIPVTMPNKYLIVNPFYSPSQNPYPNNNKMELSVGGYQCSFTN